MHAGKSIHNSFAKLLKYVVPFILIGNLATTASSVNASTYIDSVNLGAAADYSIVAGAAISIGAGNVLTGETISEVLGSSSGPWWAASLASANAAARTATSSSAATVFPVNRNFTAGVYRYTSYMLATGEITLDAQNDPNAVFIFQIGGYLSTAAGFSVLLTNGANPANVFWQVDSYFAPGASTNFKGIVMAGAYITTGADVVLTGKAFALGGAVTIGASNILMNSTAQTTTTPTTPITTPTTPITPITTPPLTNTSPTTPITTPPLTNTTPPTPTTTQPITVTGSLPVNPTSVSSTDSSSSTSSTSTKTASVVLTSSKNTIHFADGNLHLFLRGIGARGTILNRDRDGMLSLRVGGQLQIRQAKGFAPNSLVRVYITSPVKLLRLFRTDANGMFTGSVFLPPNSHSGVRMFKVTGYKSTGAYRTLWIRARFPSTRSTHSSDCHVHLTKTLVKAC